MIVADHAECLRHLGVARFAEQRYNQYDAAIESHDEAKGLWEQVGDSNEVAGELVRVGDVHRRLATLGKMNLASFEEAIDNYKEAAVVLGAQDYLASLDSDPNAKRDELVDKVMAAMNAHHLANALTHSAEAHIERHRESHRGTVQKNWEADPADLSKAIRLLDCAVQCYQSVLKAIEEEEGKKENEEDGSENRKPWIDLLTKERNLDLRDDLAWCLTIRGYGLLMQARHRQKKGQSQDAEEILKKAAQVLGEAKAFHRDLPGEDEDKDNLTWNLFALAAAQYGLAEKDSEKDPEKDSERLRAGERSLLEACRMLRKMTRKKKKIWFSDYLEDSLDVLAEIPYVQELTKKDATRIGGNKEGHEIEAREERDIDRLGNWWKSTVVREGQEALDNIIVALEEKQRRRTKGNIR